jgi:hypothetical protein
LPRDALTNRSNRDAVASIHADEVAEALDKPTSRLFNHGQLANGRSALDMNDVAKDDVSLHDRGVVDVTRDDGANDLPDDFHRSVHRSVHRSGKGCGGRSRARIVGRSRSHVRDGSRSRAFDDLLLHDDLLTDRRGVMHDCSGRRDDRARIDDGASGRMADDLLDGLNP